MSATKLRGPAVMLALALLSGVLVLGQDPRVSPPSAPGAHPLQSLGRPATTATVNRPGFDVLAWRRNFATLSSAEFRGAAKGADLVLQGSADAMEALLAIDAETSPSSIVLTLAADSSLALGVDGAATGLVGGLPVRVSASFYQSRAGALVRVPGGFVVSGDQIALWAERGAAPESLIVSVVTTFGTAQPPVSAVAAFGVPQLTATLQVDADGNAVASPGDTLRYQLRIPNIGDATMTGVSANLPLDANTAAVAGSLNVSPIALDQAVPATEDTPAPITLTGSDADGNALTYTVVTQPANGVVVQATPGSAAVTYTPAGNFNGTDTFTVRNNDGRVNSNEVATITVTVGAVNDAPSFTKGANQSVPENSAAQSVAGWATAMSPGPSNESGQTITFEITGNTAPALFSVAPAVSPGGTLTYTPAPTFSGTATISIRARDSGGTASGGVDVSPIVTFTIEVRAVNEAPSFTKGADQTVLEDSGAATVAGWATAISPGVNEVGQTVTFEITANNNSGLFAAGPAVASNGTLTFTPAANANGNATITLRARDDGGTADGGVDVSATQTFIISVTAVNDAPSFTKGADQTVLEDSGLQTVNGWATSIVKGPADESGQALTFVVTNNTNAALFSGVPAVVANGTLTFTPALNAHGTATITLRLDDDGGTLDGGQNQSPTQTFDITITNVNDAPSFTKGADQTVLEDGGAQTVAGWATALSPGPNETGQVLTFTVTGNNNPTLFAAGPAVDGSTGTLTYTTAANANGTATITLRIGDDGGTTNGGVNQSATQTFVIDVTAVNDAPSFTKGANQTVLEDSGVNTIPGWGTAIVKGPADESGQALTFVVTNNTNAALFSGVPAVAANGTLTFTPALNAHGTATITLRLDDDGGTLNGGQNQSPTQTFDITITNVNDAPSFTKGADQAVLEDAVAQTVAGWATALSPGPNETGQLLTFTVTGNNNPTLFAAGPAVDGSTGTLTYTTAANANGTATITLRIGDDGGTANGGVNQSATQTFVIDVTAVNDAPSFTKGANQTVLEDSGINAVSGWATAISAGGADESGQALTFVVTNNTNPALFAAGPAVAANGTLSFTPAADVFGTATITLRLDDSGDTLNGGQNQSATQTFDITVTNVNDAPSFTKGADQTVLEDAVAQTVNPWATALSAGPNEGSQTVSFEITGNSNPALFSAGPSVSPAGVLTYTPAANANGSATVGVRITDNGGTADGGVNVSVSQSFVINVTAVNDAPVADDDAYGVNEAATLNVPAAGVLDGDTDVEGTTLVTQLVTGPAHASAFTLNADGSFSYTHDGSETPLTDTFTYRAFDGDLQSNVATVTITINPINDAPIAGGDAYGVNEGATLTGTPGVLVNDTDPEGSGLTANLVSGPLHASSFTLNLNGTFSYTHDGSETLTDSFTYRAFDGAALSNVATVTITITPVNDAPVIDLDADDNSGATGGNYQFTFTELDPATPLQDATDAVVTDADHATLTSLTVTLTNRLDPGFEILDVDLATGGFNANFTKNYDITTNPAQGVLTITATTPQPVADFVTLLRRVTYSNTDLGPNPANRIVTFVANDGLVDSAAATTTITVITVNNAPVADADSYGVNEGGTINQAAPGVLDGDTDGDGDTITAVLVTGPTHAASFTLNPDGSFTYVHDGNGFATDTFTYKANDGLVDSNVATVTITVTSVNDVPSFVKGADVTVLEDSGGHTSAGWATAISAGGAEESAQVLTFNASSDNNPLFSVQPAVAANGTLTFTPAANAFGTATVTLTLSDDGGVLNGGVDTSAAQTFVITVTPVNDPPSFTKGADQTVLEDAPGVQSVSTWATAISAGPNESGQTVAFEITGNTNAGLFSVAPAVSPTGTLTYTLAANANGTAAITLRITDNGGVSDGGADVSATQTFNINVTAVNDAPSYTKGADETVLEDSGAHTTAGWATAISAGPADESTQLLTFTVTNNTNAALFSVAPAVDPSTGTLTFTPAANAFGTATITLRLDDNGGTANSGVNQSPTQTFVITVTAVNDAPSFTKGADQTPLEDASAVTATGWATAISAGPGESDLLTFNVSNDNNTLFSVQPSVAANGTLTYTLAANQNGAATVSVSLTDDASTPGVPGDDLTTAVQTFTITVTPVNDAPSFTAGAAQTVAEDSGAQTAAGWATAISAGPANESGQTLGFNVTNNTVDPTLTFTVAPQVNPTTGDLTYTPAPNAFGTGTFNVILSDNGGVLNGGVDSVTHSLTINVTAVNDAPTVTAGATLAFTEGNAATAIDTTITVADVDNANITSATVQISGNYVNGQDVLAMPVTAGIGSVFTPVNGTLTLSGSATKAVYQAALRTVTYFNGSTNPSEATRTATWVVSDGALPSTGVTSSINVIAVNSPPSGGADSWQTFGNTQLVVDQAGPSTPFVADTTTSTFGVLDNDTDPEGNPVSVVGIVGCADASAPFVCAITGGGSLTMESNGKFAYTPAAGDIVADTFQYQLRDQPTAGTPATVAVTVTLNLVDRIWYVDGDVAGPGTGTSADPLKNLPSSIGDADDYVFVHDSTVTGGIVLQSGQRLYGEAQGLSINQVLNGNAAPVNLVAAGNSPVVNATSANTVAVLANTANGNRTAVEIRGLTLSTSGGSFNAIDVTSADAANLGVTISNVTITGATAEGIDINHGSSSTTSTVALTNVTVTSAGNAIDINETAGALTVTGFSDLHVDGNTAGSGIVVTSATFDATAGGSFNQIDGGTTTVGASGNAVSGGGVILTNVSGDLAFDDLDIYAGNGSGLFVTGTGPIAASTGTRVTVAAAVADFASTGGPVVDINNATIDLPLASASSTGSTTTGVSLVGVSDGTTNAAFSASGGAIGNSTGAAFSVSGGNAAISYGGNITQPNSAAAVSVSGGHLDSVTFTGTIDATGGTGLQFDNADGTYGFTGNTALHGGDAGIDILNNSTGTFSFGAGVAITNPTGTAFNLSASSANVTYSGSITDDTGFAVDIDNHDGGIVTFQTGTLTSTNGGLRVANSNGGAINFNNPTIALTTAPNKAVTLDTANTGGTVTFSPAGGGNGLDISTTSGTGFSVLGGGTVTVSGSGNSINSSAGTALDISTTALVTGGLSFASTTSGGAATSVRLANVTPATATIALGTGSLAGTFLVGDGGGGANSGGTAIITYGGSITTATTVRAVDIQDRASGAGNITLSGAISHASGNANVIFMDDNAAGTITFSGASSVLNGGTQTAVFLTDSAGATINFTGGGLDIDATSGGGFVATGGGVVNVTGTGNSIATGTGTALNLSGGTTIGASDLTFQSISANGGTNGITLTNTGATGGLTVTGTGVSLQDGLRGTLAGSRGTGGTIQNTSGDAIVLNNVDGGVTLRSMIIGESAATTSEGKTTATNVAGDGIDISGSDNIVLENAKIARTGGNGIIGTDVTNFSIKNSEVLNAGDANDEDGLNFGGGVANHLDGTVVMEDNIVSASAENNVYISNATGTLTLSIDNTLFTLTANTGAMANGEDGLKLETVTGGSSPSITATVSNSTFDNLESDGIIPAANAGTITLIAFGNTFTGYDGASGESDNAISLGTSGSATLKFNIHDNTMNNSFNSAVIFNFNDTSTVHGIFEDNLISGSIGSAGGRGIDGALAADDSANVRLRIDGNTVTGMRGEGMFFNANNTSTLNIQVTNNNITTTPIVTSVFENLTVQASSLVANSADIVAKIENNTVKKGQNGAIGGGYIAEAIRLSAGASGTNTIQLEQGGQSLATAVRALLDANNPGAEAGNDSGLGVDVQPAPNGGGKITVVSNGTLLQPIVP